MLSGRWISVIGAAAFFAVACFLHQSIPIHKVSKPDQAQAWLIYVGSIVAFITFICTSANHTRTEHAKNALTSLQALRTDRDYIERARIVKATLKGDFSKPIPQELLEKLRTGKPNYDDDPAGNQGFSESVDFMLNQYEFIAAAARLGALDLEMLKETIRSTVISMVTAFEEYIRLERQERPQIWANLVWLTASFSTKEWNLDRKRLGPAPRFDGSDHLNGKKKTE